MAVGLSGCADAPKVDKLRLDAGPTMMSRTSMTVNDQCVVQPRPTMTTASPPRFGRVRYVRTISRFRPRVGGLEQCQGTTGASTGVVYTPIRQPQSDDFVVRVRFVDGEVRYVPYHVEPE